MKWNEQEWHWTNESRMVILTGAGVSAESGIATFRDSGGLWENHRVQDVATPEGFIQDPNLVIEFYNQRRAELAAVNPNPAHLSLAALQKKLGEDRCFLITQNIDDLHQRAGSTQVLPMHGELKKIRCLKHQNHIINFEGAQTRATLCPECSSLMRPHIVWFGETPFGMDLIFERLRNCTHFIYIGTSSVVYPAAGFRDIARSSGAKILCINPDGSGVPDSDFLIAEKAGKALPALKLA